MNAAGNKVLRKRLVEYLGGGEDLDSATANFLAVARPGGFLRPKEYPVDDLDRHLESGMEIARSLSDRESLLIHLDLEYVDFDHPEAAYVDPWRAFRLQEPTVAAVEEVLLEWGISPLHLITGQGHHLVWRIRLDSPVCRQLAELATLPGGVISPGVAGDLPAGTMPASPESVAAFGGLGMVMEFVAHRIRERAAASSEIPGQITAVHVGPCGSEGRREIVSIDISEYGDPLKSRVIRMPFTRYRKPWASGLVRGMGIERELPTSVSTVPLHEMDVGRALQLRQVESEVEQLARRASVAIPEEERGMAKLLDDYRGSRLRKFHEDYHAWDQGFPTNGADFDWDALYRSISPCAAHILREPNDLLLKPAGMELVTRCLLALGWHPRHIAGCVRSKFVDPGHGWKDIWEGYDPGMRADHYVRLFTGLVLTGLDGLVDFNCVSCQEKGFCFDAGKACSLEPSRQKLSELCATHQHPHQYPNEL